MRILLPKGEQRKFIENVLSKILVAKAAKLCNRSERTIRDWRREKFSLDKNAMLKLCEATGISFPKKFQEKNDYWYTNNSCSAGGLAVFKKYGRIGGNPEYRKKKWYEWWENTGQYNSKIISFVKPFKKPKFSEELAEFVGIILGDGSISKSQISVTLHYIDDKEYGEFVVSLIKKLFDVHVGKCLSKKYSVNRFLVSRSRLIDFCVKQVGLKTGNKIKQQVDIPEWIKRNKSYSIACLRGLMDTDGCVFNHCYKVNNKIYCYKKLAFTSFSKPLLQSVFNIMKDIGLNPRIADEDVRIDSIENVKKYFELIGSHNPKHLNKLKK